MRPAQILSKIGWFLQRDAMHKRSLYRHAVSVCVSVCLSRSWIMSKRIKKSSEIFHHRVAFLFFMPNGIAIFRRDPPPPNGGVECRWRRQKSRFWACLALVPAVSAATWQVLSTGSPVDDGHRLASYDIAGSKRRCWLWEKMTKCLWQEASTLRQRQQNSAFNCIQW